jgi:hypothetical protein
VSTCTLIALSCAVIGRERKQWYEELRHVLRTDPAGVDNVIESLQAEARGGRARRMQDGIAYFEKHAQRMGGYVALDRRHLPVGSGAVESAVCRVINLRFKAPSIFWEADTVADLMHLRAAFKAGRWDELMERVLTQTFPVTSFSRVTSDQLRSVLPLGPNENGPPKSPFTGVHDCPRCATAPLVGTRQIGWTYAIRQPVQSRKSGSNLFNHHDVNYWTIRHFVVG